MCDAFVGTWKLVSSENFDDYMKEVGKKMLCGELDLWLFLWGQMGPIAVFHTGSTGQIWNAAFYTEVIKIASKNHLFVETS